MRAAHACTHSHQQEPNVLKRKSGKEQQATEQVQLLAITAEKSTASEQQQQQKAIPHTANGNKQHLSKLTSMLKTTRAAKKQVDSDLLLQSNISTSCIVLLWAQVQTT